MAAMPSRPSREQIPGTALFKPELHHIPSQKGFAPAAHFAFFLTNSTWTYHRITGQADTGLDLSGCGVNQELAVVPTPPTRNTERYLPS
jgi:hypothetical protein